MVVLKVCDEVKQKRIAQQSLVIVNCEHNAKQVSTALENKECNRR